VYRPRKLGDQRRPWLGSTFVEAVEHAHKAEDAGGPVRAPPLETSTPPPNPSLVGVAVLFGEQPREALDGVARREPVDAAPRDPERDGRFGRCRPPPGDQPRLPDALVAEHRNHCWAVRLDGRRYGKTRGCLAARDRGARGGGDVEVLAEALL
jgi:hypothetical protein